MGDVKRDGGNVTVFDVCMSEYIVLTQNNVGMLSLGESGSLRENN